MSFVRRLLSATVVALAASAGAAQAATITEFPLLSANRQPIGIATGPDGNLWATESANPGAIDRITPTGTVTRFTTGLSTNRDPSSIAAGPDGNLWFTESANPGGIGRITPAGTITQYTAGLTNDSDPISIAAGPDGNLWFIQPGASKIGTISTSGVIHEYASRLSGTASAVAAGADGMLWFTEPSVGKVARVDPTARTGPEFSTGSPNNGPTSITAGPDGNLWFTESANPGAIGRITPAGTVTSFSTLTPNSDPTAITTGPDGNLWFTESANPGAIGRITPSGIITEYTTGLTADSDPVGIASASGALWFTEKSDPGAIGRLTPDVPSVTTPPAGPPSPTTGNPIAPPTSTPTPTPTPLAPTPAPAPAPPTIGRTAVAGVMSGTVLVRVPGSSKLEPLGAGQDIPMGSLISAAHGVVKVTDAIDHKGHTQSATVWAGSFVMTQARTGRGLTTFKLAGSLSCPSPRGVTTAAARSRAPVKLWGKDNHGRYSTRGRNSVATVRGTEWETVDSCAGTRTVVKRGLVSVRDLHRRRTVLVRAGHSYLARR